MTEIENLIVLVAIVCASVISIGRRCSDNARAENQTVGSATPVTVAEEHAQPPLAELVAQLPDDGNIVALYEAAETVAAIEDANQTIRAEVIKAGSVINALAATVSKAYRTIDNYTVRLRRWLRIKHKTRRRKRDLSTLASLRALRARTPDQAWARRAVGEGVKSCPRAGCRKSASRGSMSGMWKRSHGRTTKAPPDERGGNRYVQPVSR